MGQGPQLWFERDVITVVLCVRGIGAGFYHNGIPHRQGCGLYLYDLSFYYMIVNRQNHLGIIGKYDIYT